MLLELNILDKIRTLFGFITVVVVGLLQVVVLMNEAFPHWMTMGVDFMDHVISRNAWFCVDC